MSPRTPEEMMAAVSASMEERTGRTVDGWVALVEEAPVDPVDQRAVRRWLKEEHGLPQNSRYAVAWAAARAAGWEPPSEEDHVEAQFHGERAALRPVFDQVRACLEGLGDDVSMEGRASYLPFVRRRQFAAVAAATRTRLDVGLRFTDPPPLPLLSEADGSGQATHRLSLGADDRVTDTVAALLSAAYEQSG